MSIFRRKPAPTPNVTLECQHRVVVPRWDNLEDMGNSDRVSAFFCEGCQASFSPAEVAQFQPHSPARA